MTRMAVSCGQTTFSAEMAELPRMFEFGLHGVFLRKTKWSSVWFPQMPIVTQDCDADPLDVWLNSDSGPGE